MNTCDWLRSEFLKLMALELVLVRVEVWLTTTFPTVFGGGNDSGGFSNPGFGDVTPRASGNDVVDLAI
uniref:Uncharacterized protein n=1 Tax=Ditylenchus dipsaci TaxID=166011 RepID=A0A915CRK6_9BILA